MTTTDTIKALRDALTRIADPRNMHFAGDAQVVARDALALTADASEDAPDEFPARLGQSPCIEDRDGIPAAVRMVIQSRGSHGSLCSLYRLINVWGAEQRSDAARPALVGAVQAVDGWQWVPKEMTKDMLYEPWRIAARLSHLDHDSLRAMYAAMLAAAPAAPIADTVLAKPRTTHAKPEAGDGAADARDARKGCRDAFNLILNCRKLMAEKQMNKAANWVIACELFAVGSTTAMAICRDADIDPQAYTMEKLATQRTEP